MIRRQIVVRSKEREETREIREKLIKGKKTVIWNEGKRMVASKINR